MKNLIKIVILLLFTTASIGTKAQLIGIDTSAYNLGSLPDTINLNDIYTHQITVTNFSSTSLTGDIFLLAGIDSSGTLISVDTVGSVFVSGFGLGDTVTITYVETYNIPNSYKMGDNIVVVWPVASFGSTKDTLYQHVYIFDPNSVNSISKIDEQLLIYPNPFIDKFFIQNLSIKNDIKQVRIFDANGRLVYNEKYNKEIKMGQFNEGLYYLEIEFMDKSKKYNKLIKN